MLKHAFRLLLIAAAAAALTGGAYGLFRKFLRDRAALMSGPAPIRRRVPESNREVKTYTKQELDDMRRKGKTPPTGAPQPYIPPPTNTANDAAIQQSLRTIQEINRINEMNQRMLEQQQRTQKQK